MADPKNLSRRGFLNLGAAAGATLMLPSGLVRSAHAAATFAAIPEDKAVIAFGHVGPVTDEGWTASHAAGMKAVQEAFPKAKTVVVENIPYSANAPRIFRQFAAQGAQLIFATSNFGDFFKDVAKRAPNIALMECNGYDTLGNLGYYYSAQWYASYVTGVAAGLMSKTHKLGYIGSFPVPSVYSATNAFLMGARTVKPETTIQVIEMNSWFDPQAATQAAQALIDNGADVLFSIADEPSFLQVAQKRGKKAVTWNTDVRRYGPDAFISSIILDWNDFYVNQVRHRLAGDWSPEGIILPLAGGVDRDAWGKTVPVEVGAQADASRTKILEGWSPFVGPLKDTKGNVKVPAGHRMTEDELYHWNWAIEGVSGL